MLVPMALQGYIFLLLIAVSQTAVESEKQKLGGIFEHVERRQANMFRLAGIMYGFDIISETVEQHNALLASQAVCRMKKEGVSGIFVPPSGSTVEHVMSECNAMDVPLIGELVNVHLQPHILSEFYKELIKFLGWKTFTFLYEDSSGLVRLNQLLKTFSSLMVKQLNSTNYRTVFQEIQAADKKNILLDCTTGKLPEILKHAQQVGLMTPSHSYIITSMNLHTLDLEPYQYSGTNIICLSAIYPENEALQTLKMEVTNVNISTALVYDTVATYAHLLQQLNLTFTERECESESHSEYKSSIINYIKNNEVVVNGMTGLVHLDTQGNRTNMIFQVMQLQEQGLTEIGKWNSSEKLKLKLPKRPMRIKSKALPGKHLKVLTILSSPYVMRKNSDKPLHGNSRFEGFVVDILDEISEILGFTYEFKLNYEYGSLDPQKNKWTGMLYEIQAGRADVIVADLTITTERYSAFAFTMPFINTGISILYYKPSPHLGVSFLSIFSQELWVYLTLCFVFAAGAFYILARLSPFHRHNAKNADHFSFWNSLWFTIASMRPPGCGFELRSLSTHFMALVWWHFVVLIIATYIGGLVALLLSDRASELSIKNVYDLAHQEDVKYGATRRGSTLKFFRESSDPMYQQMYTQMVSSPDVLVPYIEAGVDRVKAEQGGYAFLTDALSIEYALMCDPELTQIGGLLDYKGYGIALPLGSPYRKAMDSALLELKESGRLLSLKEHWWHRPCHKNPAQRRPSGLHFVNLSSVFLILVIICAVAIIVAVYENKQQKNAPQMKAPTVRIIKPSPQAITRSEHSC